MTETNRDDLKGTFATNLPDNTSGEISPADIRNELNSLVDSITFKSSRVVPPIASDDIDGTAGNGSFGIGDHWVDTASGITYICADNTATAAVWQITAANFTVISDGDSVVNQIAIWQDDTTVVGTSNLTYASDTLNVTGTVAATDFTGDGAALTGVATAAQGVLADTSVQPAELGTAAATDIGDYATAAQGVLADTAVQPAELGTAAATDIGDYATAAQGALADTAVQPADIGTAAATDIGDYATAAQGALADTAVQPAELGTVAATDIGDYATAAQGALADNSLQSQGDLTFKNTFITGSFDLAAIAESKAITAIDGVVYNTSLDSDGGAWRYGAKARASSWYSEPLNTATRGATRAFPAVAVIIAEIGTVTIYDGDDPTLPMWRVEDYTGYTVYEAEAHQGKIAVATNLGLSILDFAEDIISITPAYNSSSTPALAGDSISSVKFVIEQNAESSAVTGLLKPTYFVGINGYGVQRLRWDGSVLGNYGSGEITRLGGANEKYVLTYRPISSSIAGMAGDTALFRGASTNKWNFLTFDKVQLSYFLNHQSGTFQLRNYDSNGVSELAIISSTYNTGWMVGDIRGAWLSSTDATDLVGGELVTNGTFDTDTSGWTGILSGFDNITVVANKMRIQSLNSDTHLVYAPLSGLISAGSVVQVTFDLGATDDVGRDVRIGFHDTLPTGTNDRNDLVLNVTYLGNADNQSYTEIVTLTSDASYLVIQSNGGSGTGGYFDIDNISVTLVDADRSINSKALTAIGTITKAPVATGAELMAYSGFSASNYLEQPYNTDLDFGTGDFSIMGWIKVSNNNNTTFFNRGGTSGFDQFQLRIHGGLYKINRSNPQQSGITLTSTEFAPAINEWDFLVFGRFNGVLQYHINNKVFVVTQDNLNLDGTSAQPTTLGGSDHSKALWRISATAPSAAQIAKIYEDEKHLFRDNALAVLSDDSVTALSHDPITDLLYVGGASGMTTIAGITPVSRDNTAVSTFISVVDGMEIKQ